MSHTLFQINHKHINSQNIGRPDTGNTDTYIDRSRFRFITQSCSMYNLYKPQITSAVTLPKNAVNNIQGIYLFSSTLALVSLSFLTIMWTYSKRSKFDRMTLQNIIPEMHESSINRRGTSIFILLSLSIAIKITLGHFSQALLLGLANM